MSDGFIYVWEGGANDWDFERDAKLLGHKCLQYYGNPSEFPQTIKNLHNKNLLGILYCIKLRINILFVVFIVVIIAEISSFIVF